MTVPPRYIKQSRFAPLGAEGQARLHDATVLICGCGALGSVLAETLTRAGVGRIRLVDRDFVELSNLHRQVLYDEQDVQAVMPKAIAAQRKLQAINSDISIEAEVCDVDHTNIQRLLEGVDCICDGTDNFETRFLLNDASHAFSIPWVYGGCVGAEGQQMTVLPGETPCLRCLMGEVPPPGTLPTCDTVGVLSPIVNVIASVQAMEAMKILSGNQAAISRTLNVFDLWDSRIRQIKLDGLRENSNCTTCRKQDYPWLRGERIAQSSVLCGRNAVQLNPPHAMRVDLNQLREKLEAFGQVTANPFLLRAEIEGYAITVFADGRTIVGGTEDAAEAKTVQAKFIGV